MNPPDETQLLTTGHVIARTRAIESRMAECGASGTGLREKSDSLGNRLPAEAHRLLVFVGNIRNRFAHEEAATLTPEERELFDAAATEILAELDKLSPAPPRPVPETEARPEKPASGSRPLAWIPGLHLIYALKLLWDSVESGKTFLYLIVAEAVSLPFLWIGIRDQSYLTAGFGATLFALTYFYGLLLGLRERKAGEPFRFYFVPLLNFGWFFRQLTGRMHYPQFIVAVAVIGIWLAAIQLAANTEYTAAAVIAALSYLCALTDSLFRRS